MAYRFAVMLVFWVIWDVFFPMTWEEFALGYVWACVVMLLGLSAIEYTAVLKDHYENYKHKKISSFLAVFYSNCRLANLDLNASVYGLIAKFICMVRDMLAPSQASETLQSILDRMIESLCNQGFEFEKHYYRVRPMWIKSASEEILSDSDFMLEMINRNPKAACYLSEDLANEESFMLKAIDVSQESVVGAGSKLKRDYRFFMKAYDIVATKNQAVDKDSFVASATPHTQKEIEAVFYIRECGEVVNEKVHVLQQKHVLELKKEGVALGKT